MSKHSKEEVELERIAKNLPAMPHTDRDIQDADEEEAAQEARHKEVCR